MIQISPIPALEDNYIWIIQHAQQAVIVDPSEAEPVLDFLAKYSLKPTAILLTHNHNDHTGGVGDLVMKFPHIAVIGPQETACFNTQTVEPQQQLLLGDLSLEVMLSAGHTAGHISYLLDKRYLFCGDALFSGGCGRVFTGDYQAQFLAIQHFKQLPDDVLVYPAHEYTQSNLKFAQAVLPPTCALMEYQERADILRSQKRPTLPTTIGAEKQINPFMQVESVVEFIRLRQQKDQF